MADPAIQSGIVTEQGQDPASTVVTNAELPAEIPTEENLKTPQQLEQEIFGSSKKPEVKQEEVKPVEQPVAQAPVVDDFKTKEDAYLARIAELESRTAAIEEFEKNPQQFLAKYASAMVKEQFNPIVYVQNKIDEKYSTRDELGNKIPFVPDASKALIPGTPDYNYANDLEQFKREAQSYLETADTTLQQQTQEAMQRLDTAKQSVKTKYGMTDDVFNQKIWKKLENIENSMALELMADGIMLKEKLETMQQNIRDGVNRTEVVTSASNLGTNPPVSNPQYDAVVSLFGKKAADRAYTN